MRPVICCLNFSPRKACENLITPFHSMMEGGVVNALVGVGLSERVFSLFLIIGENRKIIWKNEHCSWCWFCWKLSRGLFKSYVTYFSDILNYNIWWKTAIFLSETEFKFVFRLTKFKFSLTSLKINPLM